MMRMKIIVASLAGLLLAGCETDGTNPSPGTFTLPAFVTTNPTVARLIGYATAACSWEPTIATATSLIAAAAGYDAPASVIKGIADKACAMISKPGARRAIARGKPPVLYGVPLHGKMVPRR